MICKRCGGDIDTRRRRSDGSLQCPQCKIVYRPRPAQPQHQYPVAQTQKIRKQSPRKKKKGLSAFFSIIPWKRKFLKIPLWAWAVVILIILIVPSANNDTPDINVEAVEVLNASTPEPDFVGFISRATQGSVGEGEAITNVSLINRDLCVVVDMSNANPSPFTIEELAASRTGSITDEILNFKEYDGLWDTITIDFGSVGKVVNKKEDIVENEYGMRYFPSEKCIIVQPTHVPTQVPTQAPTQIPTPTDAMTLGERNALNKAKSYLEIMPFSYVGLGKQLMYEGFTKDEAKYGVDNCGANWNEQAAKKAASYLDIMSFSRQGLIEQLEYDDFTHEQAVYGVTQVGY